MIELKRAIVDRIRDSKEGLQEISLIIDHKEKNALNYVDLNGPLQLGDRIIVNTTACTLGLGTGGYHFVVANYGADPSKFISHGQGMKLKYLPCQTNILFAEEENSPLHHHFRKPLELKERLIFIGELHSMLLPLCAHLKYKTHGSIGITAILTDHGALPLWMSRNVSLLKDLGLLDNTITIGNAIGGDYECVNIYTALQLSANILRSDATIITMGPGIMGTGTPFGFSGLELGFYLDFCIAQKARALAIPRISFKDSRKRHLGLSHHFINTLGAIVQNPTSIIIPNMEREKLLYIVRQLYGRNLMKRHRLTIGPGKDILNALNHFELKASTMGRTPRDDPDFFYGIGAVAEYGLCSFFEDHENRWG